MANPMHEIPEDMHDAFEKILSDYQQAKVENAKGFLDDFGRYPENLRSRHLVPQSYRCKIYIKVQRWADVPWMAFLDPKITTTARAGVYICYLFSKSGKRLYLTLRQGCMDVSEKFKGQAEEQLKKRADTIRRIIGPMKETERFRTGRIMLGESLPKTTALYEDACIYSIAYEKGQIPDTPTLEQDLKNMVRIYQKYADAVGLAQEKETLTGREKEAGQMTENQPMALNTILFGPPGTGKTYHTVQYAVAICDQKTVAEVEAEPYAEVFARYQKLKDDGRIVFTTFHQSYGYEEFMEGIAPVLRQKSLEHTDEKPVEDAADTSAMEDVAYELKDGVFKELCCSAWDDATNQPKKEPYVLIIDEINRGNISKIFGELITLIEDDKRLGNPEATTARLPYSGETFGVPNNVYLLGTMNTADRSIAIMDTALRRRFRFVEMMPQPELLDGLMVTAPDQNGTLASVDVGEMLAVMNQRIEVLFDRDHTLGHAFFLPLARVSDDAQRFELLGEIFQDKIIPLLQEYFYEDYAYIQLVLGDNAKPPDDRMILDELQAVSAVFRPSLVKPDPLQDLQAHVMYRIQPEAFQRIESYQGIIGASV